MMKLYWSPRSRSFSALWMMEETGQPYERVLTDISTGAQKKPEFLAINPMGKVPALQDGDATLAEAVAICAYVAERYPDAKLAPPLGDPRRAKYLYWLFFAPGCIEPAMVQIATKIQMSRLRPAGAKRQRVFDVLDARADKGPWMLGEQFSAADVVIGVELKFVGRGCSRWCRHGRRSTPISTRCAARPAFQRARHASRAGCPFDVSCRSARSQVRSHALDSSRVLVLAAVRVNDRDAVPRRSVRRASLPAAASR